MKIPKIELPELKIPKIDTRTEAEKIAEFRAKDLEEESKKEIGEQLQAIKAFEQKLKDQWEFEGDASYYFSICFRSKAERNEFLDRMKLSLHNNRYMFYEDIKSAFKEP